MENNQITKWIEESRKETIQYEMEEANEDLSNISAKLKSREMTLEID